ncbi:phage tail protein [Escherichia coli]|uniref:gp53-like domain-containing protein n=1 Tax=Escherichia coli TaxID=562 RepID=UPI0038B4242C
MAKNDFKAFATGKNANVMSQEEWEALPALLSGFTAGKASSAQVNKVIRQASFIAAALAQFVSDKTQRDVLDNGDLPGFVELLGSGFAVEYLSRKNPFGDIKSDGTVKTALENLGLRASGQYTDNLLFTGPDGLKIQVFRRTLANSTTVGVVNSVPVTFPVPFPVNCWGVFSTKLTWVQITNSCEWVSNTGFTAQVMMNIAVNTNTSDAMFLAIGY